MAVLDSRTHGIIDYVTGVLLLAAPYVFGFADGTAAQWVPMLLGAAVIGMSLLTDYEFGVARIIPLPAHLMVDAAAGLLLAASPWLFGFADRVFWPHLIVGLAEVGVSAMTKRRPETASATGHRV